MGEDIGRTTRRPRPFGIPSSLALQLLQLLLTPVVLGELLLEALAEHAEGRDQRVELVQRVGAPALRVDLEPQLDVLRAVRDLEDRPRLEVLRAVRAVVVAVRQVARTALGRV